MSQATINSITPLFVSKAALSENGVAAKISETLVTDLLIGSDEFHISFDIMAGAADQTGEILRYGVSLIVQVSENGELVIRARDADDQMRLMVTDGARLNTVTPKSVDIALTDGELSVLVNGAEVGDFEMGTPVAEYRGGYDLYIGNPWGKQNFTSEISNLRIAGSAGAAGRDDASDNSLYQEGSTMEDEVAESINISQPISEDEAERNGSTVSVSNLEGLHEALANARGGETILLAPGDYGDLRLTPHAGYDYTFSQEVTIKSAKPESPANFSGLGIWKGRHLTFEDIVFDYTFAANDMPTERPFDISHSSNIAIRNSVFDGDLAQGISDIDDGRGWATGLSVRDGNNIMIEDNEFYKFLRGAVVRNSDDIVVRENHLHDMRMDGFNFAANQGLLIEGNLIHNFDRAWGADDHADMIQFWTRKTDRPTTDVIIRDNRLDIGEGGFTQSIFMRNEEVDMGYAGEEMFYRNVTIENNTIVNGHLHGINVGEVDGLVIRGNTVVHADGGHTDGADSSVEIPQIAVADRSKNVKIEANVSSKISGWAGQVSWEVSGNVLVQDQDPDAPGYYGNMFVASSLEATDGIHDIRALPGGSVGLEGVGASLMHDWKPGLMAEFHIMIPEGDTATRLFDGRYSTIDGARLPENARFVWTFENGSTIEAPVVQRAYSGRSDEIVDLTVILPDGSSHSASRSISIDGPEMVWMENGTFIFDNGTEVQNIGAVELSLGESGTTAKIDAAHVEDLVGAEEFSIAFSIDPDGPQSDGEIFRYGTSFVSSIKDDGELFIFARTETGPIYTKTDGAALDDDREHAIELAYAEGYLEILIDGRDAGGMNMDSALVRPGSHDFYFGNPWGQDNYEGKLTSFEMTREASDFGTEQIMEVEDPFLML